MIINKILEKISLFQRQVLLKKKEVLPKNKQNGQKVGKKPQFSSKDFCNKCHREYYQNRSILHTRKYV